jgi:hypothetical protein
LRQWGQQLWCDVSSVVWDNGNDSSSDGCGDGGSASQTLLWIGLKWKHQPYKFNTKGLIVKLDCFK